MNIVRISKDNQRLYLQRNILLLIAVVLLISNLFLSIWVIGRKERMIIIPAIKEEVSVIGDSEFSESYVEQMTIFFVELLLDLTAENIKYKSQLLLKHVASENYHSFLKHYKEEEERYRKYRVATKFDIKGIKILEGGKRVEIEGLLSSRFGEDSMKQKEVVARYKKAGGRLLLEGFSKKVVSEGVKE